MWPHLDCIEDEILGLVEPLSLADLADGGEDLVNHFLTNRADLLLKATAVEAFVLGTQIQASSRTRITIDFLAIDKKGKTLVFHFPRGNERNLEGLILNVAHVASRSANQLVQHLGEARRQALRRFLDASWSEINHSQQVVLVVPSETHVQKKSPIMRFCRRLNISVSLCEYFLWKECAAYWLEFLVDFGVPHNVYFRVDMHGQPE